MRSLVVVALVVIVSAAIAHPAVAQPGTSPAQPVSPAQPASPPYEGTALMWSLGGTLVSWGALVTAVPLGNSGLTTLGAVGTLVGPSFGHFYAGGLGRGLGARLLGGLLVVAAAASVIHDDCEDDCHVAASTRAELYTGLGLYLAGTLYDIATAPGAARGAHEKSRGVAVVPMVQRGGGGALLSGRF